ncbi:MAG: two-component sensor histidine kinase [Firmicutes bacterium HGW-Firmicutes-20]|nr:MAG: two-component sensor histidine kinase [Firmicutes bacterium HGW-Firmicutes-20]PKM87544.1 MAG: two-component sensor histidine kinase [Firmicutes bacterium HGW-Firmicutes-10]
MSKNWILLWLAAYLTAFVWAIFVNSVIPILFLFLFNAIWLFLFWQNIKTKISRSESFLTSQLTATTKDNVLKSQQLATLITHIPSPLALVDMQGELVIINDRFKRLMNDNEPLINFQSLSLPVDVRYFIRESYLNEASNYKTIHLDGVDYQALSIPVKNNNRYGGCLIILQDITRVLEGERLQKRFIADASHELKTPIASIKGMAEILNRPSFDDQQTLKEFLLQISKEANRLETVVADLLFISKMSSNRMYLDVQKNDVTVIIRQAFDSLRSEFSKKGITFEFYDKEVFIESDIKQMYQVFSNLLSNAIQYTDQGYIRVNIDKDQQNIVIRITDTGMGISEADLPFVFERFYRSSSDRSRDSGGSGLGLAIVKSIITAHGGQISVNSQLDHGTTFVIEMPIVNTKLTNR